MNYLSTGGEVDKTSETERIREVAQSGAKNKLKSVKVDLFLVSKQGQVFMFDLKTVKPNNCFERAGIELRPEIDKYFSKFLINPKVKPLSKS